MPIPLTPMAKGVLTRGAHELATCWKITRTDNVVYRFTDHDCLLLFQGDMYKPVGGFSFSAKQKSTGLKERNLEFLGAITDDAITTEDLRAGRFRNAKIEEYVVNHAYPWFPLVYSVFWLQELGFNGQTWNAQLEGLTAYLRTRQGRVYTRSCRHRLGDAGCKMDLTGNHPTYGAWRVNGTVSAAAGDRVGFAASAMSSRPDSWYASGNVTWLSGANVGISMDVKAYADTGRQFVLQLPLPFDIQVGDTFRAEVGCDHLVDTCKTKFVNPVTLTINNIDNFGGFPFIPGNDSALNTPNSK